MIQPPTTGPSGRREHRDDAGKRRCDALQALGKEQEHRREHGRDQRPAGKALEHAPGDESAEARGAGASGRGEREHADGGDEQPAHRHDAGEEAGERDRDHLGDEIRGLDPAHLVRADRERRLDRRQRGRDDLDVEDRHEHAKAHHGEARPNGGREALGRHYPVGGGHWRNGARAAFSVRMRTASTAALRTEKASEYQGRPKTKGSTATSAVTTT